MKKRLTGLFLALLLFAALLPAAAPAESSAPEADERQIALDLLMICGFSAEYGDEKNALTRWEDDIHIYAGGWPTEEDLAALDAFIQALNARVPNLPLIRRVKSVTQANIEIYFVPYADMEDYVSGYVENSWGMVTYWYTDFVLNRAEIAIASDVTTQQDREQLIQEEIVNGLGLGNDQTEYENSIIYQYTSDLKCLSDVDWLMLEMLYSPMLRPGMTAGEAYEALSGALKEGLFTVPVVPPARS